MTCNDKLGKVVENIDFLSISNRVSFWETLYKMPNKLYGLKRCCVTHLPND